MDKPEDCSICHGECEVRWGLEDRTKGRACYIVCLDCRLSTRPFYSKKELIEYWNNRDGEIVKQDIV